MESRWVALDVGETLVDETRIWSTWADLLGIPAFTLMAALGAEVANDGDHRDAFAIAGVAGWQDRWDDFERAYGGFKAQDLYPDALAAVQALCAAGYRVAIVANQPSARSQELRALGFDPDVMAMSQEMGLYKPDPAFFARALELVGSPDPSTVAYVGDRVDNDVLPCLAAGMRPVWIRRGPWGVIQELPDTARDATMVVKSLTELVEHADDLWR